MAQLQPGFYLYTDEIVRALWKDGFKPERVEVRQVDKNVLGVFFEGRDDYDLASEMTGRFEPDEKRS